MLNSSITRNKVKWAWDRCIELAFPRTCVGCGRLLCERDDRFLCTACAATIDWIREPACTCCGAQFFGKMAVPGICSVCRDLRPQFDQCKSLFHYRGIGARLVHALKYEGGTWLQPQIEQIIERNPTVIRYLSDSILVPVPLHWWRMNRRGYNQAVIIAQAVESVIPTARMRPILTRIRLTGSQTLLSREDRLKNMKNAFLCRKFPGESQKIVLIDDVLTTGSTLNAAATALKRAGVHKISAFTMAHG